SAYKNLATHITFPPDYSNFTNCKTIIVDLDPDKAFYWTALVLGEFKETLSSFALRQADFDESLLHGNYSRAQEILNEIEDEFGVSIWFITKKLTLLQLSEGRSAQKKYVQDTIDTNEFSILAAMSAYFISMALDESLSIAQLLVSIISMGARTSPANCEGAHPHRLGSRSFPLKLNATIVNLSRSALPFFCKE
ncbi:TPA: hypothetical protein VEM20_005964, partial [Pseudomonas aeruginosa]|nr:hypothetical protein [Pseudomonas aeruginosa]